MFGVIRESELSMVVQSRRWGFILHWLGVQLMVDHVFRVSNKTKVKKPLRSIRLEIPNLDGRMHMNIPGSARRWSQCDKYHHLCQMGRRIQRKRYQYPFQIQYRCLDLYFESSMKGSWIYCELTCGRRWIGIGPTSVNTARISAKAPRLPFRSSWAAAITSEKHYLHAYL